MHRPDPLTRAWALAHAGEFAQWTVMLLAWVWLGEQGMRLGWSLASGVLAVALWWAARLLCRGGAWALQSSPRVMLGWGVLTACGVFLPGLWSHVGVLALAVLWGVWSGLIETRSPTSTFRLGSFAWHPLLAAGAVALAWRLPGLELASGWDAWSAWRVSFLLALCAALLYARERAWPGQTPACLGQRARAQQLLAPSVMGLMMGSLWLGNVWCVGLGWSSEGMVLAHLALMAGLPSLMPLVLRGLGATRLSGAGLNQASLILLALGALMVLGDSALHGVLAMLLPSLAWALHCYRHSHPSAVGTAALSSPWVGRGTALVLGPGLLLWVGLSSSGLGPWAVNSAMALLGALAAMQVLFHLARVRAPAAASHPS